MSESKGYIHPEALVDVEWVQAHLADSTVRLIEVDVDTTAYEQGHIPGAVGFNWQRELQDQIVRAPVSKERLEELLSRAGVTPATTIVLYGDNNNWFAAWALWILKYYGHRDVRLLNGGRVKWLADKREITTALPSYPHTNYTAHPPQSDIRAFRDQILPSLGRNSFTLVDVRSPGEYSGDLLAPANLPQEGAQRGGLYWLLSTSVRESGSLGFHRPPLPRHQLGLSHRKSRRLVFIYQRKQAGMGSRPAGKAYKECRRGLPMTSSDTTL